jgi:ectoine hydroxylase-related dioxygenase (phytanoyl-CoA dioxygenase family)
MLMTYEYDFADLTAPELVSAFDHHGFVIVRSVFTAEEIACLAAAFDRVQADALSYGRSFRHGNLFYNVSDDAHLGTCCRMVQWPAYKYAALNRLRLDLRFLKLLTPLIGGDLKQIINQLHWKYKGAASGDFAFHQDSRFRKPESAYRDLAGSYVQTGLAIDRHAPDTGGMRFIRGSHKQGAINLHIDGTVMENAMSDFALVAAGLDPADQIDLYLAPGDVALWHVHLVHGSGPNSADHQRRLYINGYVRTDRCDRGEVSFRDGIALPLGETPSLIHFEQLYDRPEPHFV